MRVLLFMYGSRGDVEPLARVCALPDCVELLACVGVPLVPIGVCR
jgi:hypothetical protein